MRREIEAITSKARRSRRELRGVVVALLLLGCSTHLAFAHATLNVPASAVLDAQAAEPVVASTEREEPVDVAHQAREWMPPSRRGCLRMARCNATRRVPRPSAEDAERAVALGVGDDHAARSLLVVPPRAEWVTAVASEPAADLLWPVPEGRFGRGVGRTRERRIRRIPHQGVDIVAPQGSPILAVNDGVVAYSDNGIHGYGNLVVLVHADGTSSHYAHCHATFVVAGQRVQRGEVIAEVGATGLARGPHLHFEWRSGARYRDPAPRFTGRPPRR